MNDTTDFSFAHHVPQFRKHISSSIPGYANGLIPTCESLSRRFVQPETTVLDVGCSDGHLLALIRKANQAARPNVEYVGIDIEPSFINHRKRSRAKNLRIEAADARTYQGYENLSFVLSAFTVQFIRPQDKLPLLQRIHNGLVEGGALIIAEKTLAQTSRVQDAWTFPYYDHKLKQGFTAEEILNKERSLRGQMTLWTEGELRTALWSVGFHEIEPIWRSSMFVGYLALKAGLRERRQMACQPPAMPRIFLENNRLCA
jgi:tRNA (cmo5U34)-methyltransferase